MFKFFRHLKYKKMVKTGSSLLLADFAEIINSIINRLEKDGRIKTPLHKEVLKFESTALVFWLFRQSDVFPEMLHRLTLDEIHQQYFRQLKKHGYDKAMVQAVCDDFTVRYKTYDKFVSNQNDFVKVGTSFARFVSEKAKTELDATEMTIPLELVEKTTLKFKEILEVMKT